MRVRCSGVIELEKGIDYCGKQLDKSEAIHLYCLDGLQTHDMYFCSFVCLCCWLRHSRFGEVLKCPCTSMNAPSAGTQRRL